MRIKKVNFISAFFSLLILLGISACDKIETPIANVNNGGGSPNAPDTVIKKILIEEFTGHTCGNCPGAARTADQLQNLYGQKLIVVGVHAGFFARPRNFSNGSFKTDFRTEAGEEYSSLWIASNPSGFVNRTSKINNTMAISHTAWGEAVEMLKDEMPDVRLDISLTWSPNDRVLNTTVKTTGINNVSGNYNLIVYLVEDNITDWQKDYSLPTGQHDVENYLHRHVLRDNINGLWGEAVISGSFAPDATSEKKYSNYILKPEWNAEECSVVAYLYNTTTNEILQVEEAYLMKK